MHDSVGESNPQGTGCSSTTDINDLCTNHKIPKQIKSNMHFVNLTLVQDT